MNEPSWFISAPMIVLFVVTIVLVVAALVAGIRIGAHWRARSGAPESIGSAVAATLGLLAFMLGFAFNMAANRLDERKGLFVDEVNAIETAHLRAGLLGEPWAGRIQATLLRYVDVRAAAVQGSVGDLEQAIAASGDIQLELWRIMEEKLAAMPPTVIDSLVLQALNEVFDLHTERVVVALQFRIPATIWYGLYGVAILAMLMVGFQFGQGEQRQPFVILALALSFSAVILLIMDLDRAAQGTVRIDQRPLIELQERLHAREP